MSAGSRFGTMKIWQSDAVTGEMVLVRDFSPQYDYVADKACYYDAVSGTKFYNKHTSGSFTYAEGDTTNWEDYTGAALETDGVGYFDTGVPMVNEVAADYWVYFNGEHLNTDSAVLAARSSHMGARMYLGYSYAWDFCVANNDWAGNVRIENDIWHHVVVTNRNEDGRMQVYIDGGKLIDTAVPALSCPNVTLYAFGNNAGHPGAMYPLTKGSRIGNMKISRKIDGVWQTVRDLEPRLSPFGTGVFYDKLSGETIN